MAEGKMLFSLDLKRFREIWDNNDWLNLQNEFKTKNVPLSNSLLKWEAEHILYLADFENMKSYDIHEIVGKDPANPIAEVRERGSEEEQLVTSKDTDDILSHLQTAQGTDRGFIELITRLDLEELDLERLKRSDLAGAGFSFEFLHENLLIVHGMFRDILTSSRESLLNLSQGQLITVNQNLQTFYEHIRQIEDFEISGENPREAHTNLLQDISVYCDSMKQTLGDITAFLSSRKVSQLESQVNATTAKAVDRLNTQTSRTKQNNEEAEKQESNRQQEFNQLKLELQNQLAEKPISQYKAIFQEQAKAHHKNARFWLGMAGAATVAFAVAFVLLSIFVKIEGTQLAGTLQNLFTKGFLLSPIYVWLNRSIKNHTAQKHLEVINTHRQNALETFDTFVAAAEGNRETRDAVLLAATEAIFDANQTGYLSTKTSGPDSRSPVQQVIREIMPQKPPTKDG